MLTTLLARRNNCGAGWCTRTPRTGLKAPGSNSPRPLRDRFGIQGTLDHMRRWPSLPLGWVGRVSRPYTGLPDHALRLSQGVKSKEITPEATREGTPKGARHLGLLSSDTSHGLQSHRSLAPNPPHMQPINIHTIRFPRR